MWLEHGQTAIFTLKIIQQWLCLPYHDQEANSLPLVPVVGGTNPKA